MEYLFLFKQAIGNRVTVRYIEPMKFECGHYFGGGGLECAFCNEELKLEKIDFDNIQTILTKKEFEILYTKQKELNDLGFGLDDPKRKNEYEKGLQILKELEPIYEKLRSEDNQKLFNSIVQEEAEFISNEYDIDEDEVFDVFENYGYTGLPYKDRHIISTIFENTTEVGEEWVDSGCMIVSEEAKQYLDFERLGEDIVENNESYYKLNDGRVVCFYL